MPARGPGLWSAERVRLLVGLGQPSAHHVHWKRRWSVVWCCTRHDTGRPVDTPRPTRLCYATTHAQVNDARCYTHAQRCFGSLVVAQRVHHMMYTHMDNATSSRCASKAVVRIAVQG